MRLFGGLRPWVWQRLTAIYMLLFMAAFALAVAMTAPPDHAAWRNLIAAPAMSVGVALFVGAVLLHAWIGLRDIVLDYIHAPPARALILGVGVLALLAMALRVAVALIALHGPGA